MQDKSQNYKNDQLIEGNKEQVNINDHSSVSLLDEFVPLPPNKVKFKRDQFGELVLEMNGNRYEQVMVNRAFPYSAKEQYIIIECEDEEIGIIEDLNQLTEKNKDILNEELKKTYYIPIIKKVNDVKAEFLKQIWYVETDRGEMKFEVNSRRDSNYISKDRLVIKDTNGNKYEIEDYSSLDQQSKDLIEREVT